MPIALQVPWRSVTPAWTGQSVVFISRFDATGLKARLRLFVGGIRLRRAVLASPGALGVSLRARPIAGRYYTLSCWRDEASLMTFAHGKDHRAVVRRVSQLGPVSGVLIALEGSATRPRWRDVLGWVDSLEPGPYWRGDVGALGGMKPAAEFRARS